jgi:hypothetical protein
MPVLGLTDEDYTVIEIDVPPPDREHFSTPHPGLQGQAYERVHERVPALAGGQQKSLLLGGLQPTVPASASRRFPQLPDRI